MQDSEATHKASKRKASHVSRACLQCRDRKVRCDGVQPDCSACRATSQACEYSSRVDGRRAGAQQRSAMASARRALKDLDDVDTAELKRRNTALRQHILALERGLSARGFSVSEVLLEETACQSHKAVEVPDTHTQARCTLSTPRVSPNIECASSVSKAVGSQEIDHHQLQVDDSLSATLCYFGPTSALNHLAAAPSCLQSPLSLERSTLPDPGRDTSSSMPRNQAQFPWLEPDPEIDWARNLPDLGISSSTHEALLELCEAFFAPWCWVVNLARFREDMRVCLRNGQADSPYPARTPFYSPLLHNMILAMGACMWRGGRVHVSFPAIKLDLAADSNARADYAADAFAANAKRYFDIECERPMQSTVNGLLLMASFHSGNARPNLGHVMFTTAVATSHSLGIHIDSTSFVKRNVIPPEVVHARDQLFWTVYAQDKLWSMAIGRYGSVSSDDHNIGLPAVDAVQDALPWKAPRVWTDASAMGMKSAHGHPSSVSSCHLATVKLAMIQHRMLATCYSLGSDLDTSMPNIERMQGQLLEWHEQLPSCVRLDGNFVPPPHVLTLHLTYNYTVMLLTRPIWQRSSQRSHLAIQRCGEAAVNAVELLELYDRFYGVNYAPLSSLQTTFVAGTVHLLRALEAGRQGDPVALQTALRASASCISSLDKASTSWRSGARISSILQSLLERWLPGCIQHMRENGWLREGAQGKAPEMGTSLVTSIVPVTSSGHPVSPRTAASDPWQEHSADFHQAAFSPSALYLQRVFDEQPDQHVPTLELSGTHEDAGPARLAPPQYAGTANLSSFDFSIEAFDEMLRASCVD